MIDHLQTLHSVSGTPARYWSRSTTIAHRTDQRRRTITIAGGHGVSVYNRIIERIERMKALLMRSFNPAEVVEIMKIDEKTVEEAKRKEIRLSKTVTEQYDIRQTIVFEENLKLREVSREKTDRYESQQFIDINLKEGDVLIKTNLGYKVNMLPIKIITDKEERLITKYNTIGK